MFHKGSFFHSRAHSEKEQKLIFQRLRNMQKSMTCANDPSPPYENDFPFLEMFNFLNGSY